MAAWLSSSLVARDTVPHELPRHQRSGLLKNNNGFRISKQMMTERKMFGSRMGRHGQDFSIGKKFRGLKNIKPKKIKGSYGAAPSAEEFDRMLGSSVTHDPNKKKSMFKRKFF